MNITKFPKRKVPEKPEPPPRTKLLDLLLDGEGRSRVTTEIVNLARNLPDVADRQAAWKAIVEKYRSRMRHEGGMPGDISRALNLLAASVKAENHRRDEIAIAAIGALEPFVDVDFKLAERGQILRFPADDEVSPAGAGR